MDRRVKRIGLKEAIESSLNQRKCKDCKQKQNCSPAMEECCKNAFMDGFTKGSKWMQRLVVGRAFDQKEWEQIGELIYMSAIDAEKCYDGFISLLEKRVEENKRTIKFRAHSKTGPLWVYGNYKYVRSLDQHLIENENGTYEVSGDTVCQYWRKANGQDLYDGDILTVNGAYPKLVKWIDEYASFCIANIDSLGDIWTDPWKQPSLEWFNLHDGKIKVIGNMYDNLELLKDKIVYV